MVNKFGAHFGINLAGETEVLAKNPPKPLCPPHIPQDLTWDIRRAAEVGKSEAYGMKYDK
jgi:hypothetical protein